MTRERQSLLAGIDQRFRPFGSTLVLENAAPIARLSFFAGVLVTVNIAVIGVFLIVNDETQAGLIGIVLAATYGLSTIYYVVTGHAYLHAMILVWCGTVGIVAMHVVLGGYAWSGAYLGWGISQVVVIALFSSRRATATIVSVLATAALALAILEPALQGLREGPTPVQVPAVLAANWLIVTILLLAYISSVLVGVLAREQGRNQELLLKVLPAAIANRLKESPGVIAERFENCTVLFADIVGFTPYSATVSPDRLVEELNHVFSRFDELVAYHGVEKIKTIGDGYMAAAGAPVEQSNHVAAICDLAIDMQNAMSGINGDLDTEFELRVGVNTGQVVGGVIGISRFSYDLWGDTVNVASRLEEKVDPGRVLVSHEVVNASDGAYRFSTIGEVELKGKGAVTAYILEGRSQ
jgi:class 3 adenylate cyclase